MSYDINGFRYFFSSPYRLKGFRHYLLILLITFSGSSINGQDRFKLDARPEERLASLWQNCTKSFISDKDSSYAYAFFNDVIRSADSAGDRTLAAYAQYFRKCWNILFADRYENHFAPGDYQSVVSIFANTQTWALKSGYEDIAASCEHYIGQVYYRSNRYGMAFEHLLKADDAFRKIGYEHVPNAPEYLYNLGLHFYQFEEYDRALKILLQATQYHFFLPRVELNTLNAIGLIYARQNEPQQAVRFLMNTINKAIQYKDTAWIGIGAGNLGNVFLAEHKNDSALNYHRKNFLLNTSLSSSRAPEDAAKSALSMAKVFLLKHLPDSALFYIAAGNSLADTFIKDSTERMEFRRRQLKVSIDYLKENGDFKGALLLQDSLFMLEHNLRGILDSKILSRAVEKTEAKSYDDRIHLLKSQKDLNQFRFYFLLASFSVLLILVLAVFRDKWLRRKRQIQLAEKDKQILQVEKLRAEDGLKHAEHLLNAYMVTVKEKTTLINHLETELTILKKTNLDIPVFSTITSNREKLVASTILTDNEWKKFRDMFEQVYPGFSYRLKETYPELSPAEARFLYLTKLHLSSREMAAMLGISVQTIHKLRYRLRKKLHLEEDNSFETLLRKVN